MSANGEIKCKCDSSAQLDLSKAHCITNSNDCGEGGQVAMEEDFCSCMDGYAVSLDGKSCVMLQPCGGQGMVGTDGHCVCKSGQSLLNKDCVVQCPTGYISINDASGSRCVCDVENGYVASLDGTDCVEMASLNALHQVALSGGTAACAVGFVTSVDRRECVDILGSCAENEITDIDEGACVCGQELLEQLIVSLNGSVCVTRAQCRADANALDY